MMFGLMPFGMVCLFLAISAKKNYEKFKNDISNYDTLISETIPELREQIEDALSKEIEIQITKFNLEFDVTLNLTEATKKWNLTWLKLKEISMNLNVK